MAKKRQRIDTLIDAHAWLRRKARARPDIASAAAFSPGSATRENPPFNLLRPAVRHSSQCSHMLVCDDRLPVSLFLSMSVRDINGKTPARFAKVMLSAPPPETALSKNAWRIRARHAAITNNCDNWRSYRHGRRKSAAREKMKSSLFTVHTWGTRGCRSGRELAGFHQTATAFATLHELTQIRFVTAIGFWHLFLEPGICRWCDWGIGRWRRWGIARRCLRGTF
jgi:hypothetical protein